MLRWHLTFRPRCEPLWNAAPNPESLVSTVIEALFPAKAEPDAAQVERVGQWIERGIKQNPKSALFLIARQSPLARR